MRADLIVKRPLRPAGNQGLPLYVYGQKPEIPMLRAPSYPLSFERSMHSGYLVSLLQKGADIDPWDITTERSMCLSKAGLAQKVSTDSSVDPYGKTQFRATPSVSKPKLSVVPPMREPVSPKGIGEKPPTKEGEKAEFFNFLENKDPKLGEEGPKPRTKTRVSEMKDLYADSPSQIKGRPAIHQDSPDVSSPEHKLAAAKSGRDYHYSNHMYHAGQSRDAGLPEAQRKDHAQLAAQHAHGWKVSDLHVRSHESMGTKDTEKHHADWSQYHRLNADRHKENPAKESGVPDTTHATSMSRHKFHDSRAGFMPGEIEHVGQLHDFTTAGSKVTKVPKEQKVPAKLQSASHLQVPTPDTGSFAAGAKPAGESADTMSLKIKKSLDDLFSMVSA